MAFRAAHSRAIDDGSNRHYLAFSFDTVRRYLLDIALMRMVEDEVQSGMDVAIAA